MKSLCFGRCRVAGSGIRSDRFADQRLVLPTGNSGVGWWGRGGRGSPRWQRWGCLVFDVGWAWAAVAVAAGWLAGAIVRGAVAGAVSLVSATAAYYFMDSLLREESLAGYVGRGALLVASKPDARTASWCRGRDLRPLRRDQPARNAGRAGRRAEFRRCSYSPDSRRAAAQQRSGLLVIVLATAVGDYQSGLRPLRNTTEPETRLSR